MTVRLLLADDHGVVRRGLEQLFATAEDIEVVGAVADGEAAVEAAVALDPDVVLMDLSMPRMDGVAATRLLRQRAPRSVVVVLTSYQDGERVMAALDAGAGGYLVKDAPPEALLAGVRSAAAGDAPLDARAGRVLLEARRVPSPPVGLTPRETEVLRLVRDGLANKQIGRRLHITERTVKAHLTRVFATIGAPNRAAAAVWARDHLPD